MDQIGIDKEEAAGYLFGFGRVQVVVIVEQRVFDES